MFFLMGNDKMEKKIKKPSSQTANVAKVKELFKHGRFPIVTTQEIAGKDVAKVLGLVCCRGFDADEAFFGMAAMAQTKGGQAIIGYSENIAFHPDGSKFFSCFGTAVMFARDSREAGDVYEISKSRMVEANAEQLMASPEEIAPATQFTDSQEDNLEDLLNLAVEQAPTIDQPSEEDDPVLQRLLAQKQEKAALQQASMQ